MKNVRRRYVVGLVLLCVMVVSPLVLRMTLSSEPPILWVVSASGERGLTMEDLERLPQIERRGTYQNQFSNWRDEGIYRGPRLAAILGDDAFDTAVIIASDGYRMEIPRVRVEDESHPMIVAITMDGRHPPAWADGPRIAVLPEDGDISNEEYDAVSAGSYWVKNVARIELE